MSRGDMAFKLGISFASIGMIIALLYLVFQAIREYDPVHQETIGLTMIIIVTLVGSAMFLVIIYNAIKWKGSANQ